MTGGQQNWSYGMASILSWPQSDRESLVFAQGSNPQGVTGFTYNARRSKSSSCPNWDSTAGVEGDKGWDHEQAMLTPFNKPMAGIPNIKTFLSRIFSHSSRNMNPLFRLSAPLFIFRHQNWTRFSGNFPTTCNACCVSLRLALKKSDVACNEAWQSPVTRVDMNDSFELTS